MNWNKLKEKLLPSSPTKARARLNAFFICLVLAVTVMANVVVSDLAAMFGWYFYTSERYEYTISGNTDELFEGIDEPIRIIFCASEDTLKASANSRLVWESALQLAERHSFITIEYLNLWLNPNEVKPYRGEEGKQSINENTVIFQRGSENGGEYGKDYVLQTMELFYVLDESSYPLAYVGEKVYAASILWITKYEKPIAYYTVNHGESSSSSFYSMLTYAGYDLRPLDLIQEEIDDKAELIIISNPIYDFEKSAEGSLYLSEIDKIEAFLAKGGSLYVTVDPDTAKLRNLETLLGEWGMTISDSIVRDMTGAITSDGYTLTATFPTEGIGAEIGKEISDGERRTLVSYAAPIVLDRTISGTTVSPIVVSEPSAREYSEGKLVSETGDYTLMALATRNAERGRSSIFLVSSSMLTAYDAIQTTKYLNEDLVYAVFEQFGRTSIPMGISPLMIDSSIIENLTMGEARLYTTLLAVVLPVSLATACVVVMIRRKNR